MILKNACVDLANRLIIELELDREPVENVIKIDGELMWLFVENVFDTDLLPKWTNLDCVDETEEFQFILMTLEQIFDLDLKNINPAYLTMRKPEYIHLVLNALYMAKNYIKFKKDGVDKVTLEDMSDSTATSTGEKSTEMSNSSQTDSTKASNSSHFDKLKDEISLEPCASTTCKSSKKKVSRQMKNLDDELNAIENDKRLINRLTRVKEQNFALELSYKIMGVIKVQEKSKEIETNLKKLKLFVPRLTGQAIPSTRSSQPKKLPKKSLDRKKPFSMKNLGQKNLPKRRKQVAKLDLNELLEKLSGLSTKQINKLKDSSEHQREMVNEIKLDLIERERRMQCEMLNRVDKENKVLELLKREMSLGGLSINSSEHNQDLRKARYELRKERAGLSRQLDEYYLHNLSNCRHLESEQERTLNELVKRNDKLFRDDLNEARKDVRESEKMMRTKQKSLLDNYDSFFASQSALMREEIMKQRNKFEVRVHVNNRSLSKHLEQNYKNKLYPKFN